MHWSCVGLPTPMANHHLLLAPYLRKYTCLYEVLKHCVACKGDNMDQLWELLGFRRYFKILLTLVRF